VAGRDIIAPRRSSSAHLHRPWRATLRQSAALATDFDPVLTPLQRTPRRTLSYLRRLPVSGTISRVQYEWGNGKATENLRKHGVDFADAIAALEDRTVWKKSTRGSSTARSGLGLLEWLTAKSYSSSRRCATRTSAESYRPGRLLDMSKTGTTRVIVKPVNHRRGRYRLGASRCHDR